MTHKIKYLNFERSFIIKTNGSMTGEDFVAMAKDILNHPDHKPDSNILFDHRDLNFENVTIQDIEKIRSFHRENENKIGNGRSAIVVRSRSEWNNIWDQGEKITTKNIVKIFDDLDNAFNWIKE